MKHVLIVGAIMANLAVLAGTVAPLPPVRDPGPTNGHAGTRRSPPFLLRLALDYPPGVPAMDPSVKTPVHFWIVAVLAVAWNAFGAFDYVATQTKMESYMSQFTPEQLEYFYSFPAWMDAAWAVGVWGAFLGALALLLRKSWAVWLFGASILGLAVSTVYNFVLTDGAAAMGEGATAMTAVIWAVALFLFFYARAMAKNGVLR